MKLQEAGCDRTLLQDQPFSHQQTRLRSQNSCRLASKCHGACNSYLRLARNSCEPRFIFFATTIYAHAHIYIYTHTRTYLSSKKTYNYTHQTHVENAG